MDGIWWTLLDCFSECEVELDPDEAAAQALWRIVQPQGHDIVTGERLAGELPRAKERLVVAWIELRREDLMADWDLATRGDELFRIAPLA